MGLLRLLFWIALIALAVWLWRRFIQASNKTKQTNETKEPEPMVRCAQCGVHVPINKALSHNQAWYCCPAHREQGNPEQ